MIARRCLIIIGFMGFGLSACKDADETVAIGEITHLEVRSSPEGAAIFIDGDSTGKSTNATFRNLSIRKHQIVVQKLGPGNVLYRYSGVVDVKDDSIHILTGPLTMRINSKTSDTRRYHTLNSIRTSTMPNGALLYSDATASGLIWPANTNNGYVVIGTPIIAATEGALDTLALGLYNTDYMAGRPAPEVTQGNGSYTLRQSFWILPPDEIMLKPDRSTISGIEVEEELTGTSADGDVAFIKLTFRNVTNQATYQAVDPFVPTGGVTFNNVYLGFAMDADVGAGDDDGVTYDQWSNTVYMYDFDFSDPGIQGTPGIIGLHVVDAPSGAQLAMNAWPRGFDWRSGVSEKIGWYHFSGTRMRAELEGMNVPGRHLGYSPNISGDYRMSVAAGPLILSPGKQASITVAVIMAAPVPGTFTAGERVAPGDPTVSGRPIDAVAKALTDKAQTLAAPN